MRNAIKNIMLRVISKRLVKEEITDPALESICKY